MKRYVSSVMVFGAVLLAACGDHMTQPNSQQSRSGARDNAASPDRSDDFGRPAAGGVYVATNATTGNAIVAFARSENGSLSKIGEFKTGGVGTGGAGDPLQSQGSVVLSPNRKRLFAVNAASNTISTFKVNDDASLKLVGTVSSFGTGPISLAVTDNRLYVLNQDNSVSGYSLDGDDAPRPISRAHLSLGPATDGPSTINVSRGGKFLFVTQRAAGAIDVVSVGIAGDLSAKSRRASSGAGPFGFAVTIFDQLIVSEAGAGAVSSYRLGFDGKLSVASASLPTHGGAPCWLVLTNDGRVAFVANAGSGFITGYDVSFDGTLSPLNADGRTGVTNGTGATPLDMDITRDGKFLYVLQTGTGTVGAFTIGVHGHLTTLPDTPGLIALSGFQGLAAF